MKKSLIALAVAGAFAAPAFAASSNVDVYGTIRMSVDHVSAGNQVNGNGENDGWAINDQTSRIGFKGTEDLGGGLKAVWQIEQQLSTTDPTGATAADNSGAGGAFGGAALRNTFVGLSGGFGTALIGRHDTPYKLVGSSDLFGDTAADSQKNTTGIIGRNGFDNRANQTVAYVSPDFSGFHFAAAVIPGEENVGAAGAVAGFGNDAQGLMDSYSLAGIYKNGPLNVGLGYERFGAKTNTVVGGAAATDKAKDAWKLNAGYAFGDVKVGYTYERSADQYANTDANPQSKDAGHLLSVAYGMGPITLAAQYGKFNDKGNNTAEQENDMTRWTLGVIYNLSKRTNVYAAYDADNYKADNETTQNGTARRDAKIWTFGMNHSF